jgi:hypothetical protein
MSFKAAVGGGLLKVVELFLFFCRKNKNQKKLFFLGKMRDECVCAWPWKLAFFFVTAIAHIINVENF